MKAREFINGQLALIRRTFFAKATDRQFFQERDLLEQAIAFPAARLKQRYGVTAKSEHGKERLFALYGRILRTVIDTIRDHGKLAEIERFSVYFLHAVQTHMDHHGEGYYQEAKAARSAEDLVPAVMRGVRIGDSESSEIDVIVGVHEILKSRAGRKKKTVAQPTLF